MVRSKLRGDVCGYCNACVRQRLCAARGRSPEPVECAYKHILESYSAPDVAGRHPTAPASPCSSCRWTSDAQFPETPSSASDFSLEWSPPRQVSTRRRKR